MPTLEELFKSKQLESQGGKTAKEAYAIRNSKDIRISSADPFVSTAGMLLARGARKLGVRRDESLLEQELTGIRMIRTGSIPFIYGSDIGRITLRTTDSISTMKTATSGELTGASGLFNKIKNVQSSVKKALGLPTNAIPSFVEKGLEGLGDDKLGVTQDRMNQLKKVLESSKGTAAGKLLGFVGKNATGGNFSTMGRNLVGNSIKEGKKELAQKLLGGRGNQTLGSANPTAPNGITQKPTNEFTTTFTDDSWSYWGQVNFNYGSLEPSTPPTDIDKEGSKYSKTIVKEGDDKNDISTKQVVNNIPTIKFEEAPKRISKFEKGYKLLEGENFGYSEIKKEDLLTGNKLKIRTFEDGVNQLGVYSGENEDYDKMDFVPLKFTSIHRDKTAQFRATITGLTENLSPSWDSGKFIGSPFSYYTYGGIERSVSFNFKVFALNAEEHKTSWDKINFLNSLVYPQGYYDTTAVVPPFIKFTMGDLYKNKFAFIESLSHTWDDTTPWNVSDTELKLGRDSVGTPNNSDATEISMKGYKLPTITDVGITIKFLDSKKSTSGRKFYSFNPQTS